VPAEDVLLPVNCSVLCAELDVVFPEHGSKEFLRNADNHLVHYAMNYKTAVFITIEGIKR
jgi:hypothetical protein